MSLWLSKNTKIQITKTALAIDNIYNRNIIIRIFAKKEAKFIGTLTVLIKKKQLMAGEFNFEPDFSPVPELPFLQQPGFSPYVGISADYSCRVL